RNQIHEFQLARMSTGANFPEHIPQDFAHWRSRLRRQFVKTQSADENALDLIPTKHDAFRKWWNVALTERETQPFCDREQKILCFLLSLRRKQRDVHVEAPLPLQIHFEQIRTRCGEHPEDAATIACV